MLVGEDADDVGAPLDLAVEALDWVDTVQLGTMWSGEGHLGQHIGFSLIPERGELGQLGTRLVGDPAPLALAASASSWAKAVAMKAETTRRPCLLTGARTCA
jgi:hypothetical protein